MSSRRKFLKTGLLIGGAALAGGGGYYYSRKLNTIDLARQLTSFLDSPNMASSLGAGMLESNQQLQKYSLNQMVNTVLNTVDVNREKLPLLSQSGLLERFHQQVRKDFSEGNTAAIQGWILAQTEAQLCALLVLLEKQSPRG